MIAAWVWTCTIKCSNGLIGRLHVRTHTTANECKHLKNSFFCESNFFWKYQQSVVKWPCKRKRKGDIVLLHPMNSLEAIPPVSFAIPSWITFPINYITHCLDLFHLRLINSFVFAFISSMFSLDHSVKLYFWALSSWVFRDFPVFSALLLFGFFACGFDPLLHCRGKM